MREACITGEGQRDRLGAASQERGRGTRGGQRETRGHVSHEAGRGTGGGQRDR